jgi:hypothetical protein
MAASGWLVATIPCRANTAERREGNEWIDLDMEDASVWLKAPEGAAPAGC